MNLEEIYSKLAPAQRSTVAKEMVNGMGGTGQNVDTNNVSPQQLAALHQEAQQKNPGVLQKIRNHPLMAGLLGGIATYEVDKHFGKG
jgi:hypothetical protein